MITWVTNPVYHPDKRAPFVVPEDEAHKTDPYCPRGLVYKMEPGKPVMECDLFVGCMCSFPKRDTERPCRGLQL